MRRVVFWLVLFEWGVWLVNDNGGKEKGKEVKECENRERMNTSWHRERHGRERTTDNAKRVVRVKSSQ